MTLEPKKSHTHRRANRSRGEMTDKQLLNDAWKQLNGNRIITLARSSRCRTGVFKAQNSRSEALNVMRNRKGRTPHTVVVTGEPTPSRLASLALGTGDLDVVYHFALTELVEGVKLSGNDEAIHMLNILIKGQRLRDIADLALDLAV